MAAPHRISDEAEAALRAVTDARAKARAAKAKADEAARKLVADRTAKAELELALAVRTAQELGVPHSRIGREGLGSKDWDIVHEYRAKADGSDAVTV